MIKVNEITSQDFLCRWMAEKLNKEVEAYRLPDPYYCIGKVGENEYFTTFEAAEGSMLKDIIPTYSFYQLADLAEDLKFVDPKLLDKAREYADMGDTPIVIYAYLIIDYFKNRLT